MYMYVCVNLGSYTVYTRTVCMSYEHTNKHIDDVYLLRPEAQHENVPAS